MNSPADRFNHKVSWYCGWCVAAAGLLTLAGWLFENDFLREFEPGLVTMKFNSALAFLFGGLALVSAPWWRPATLLCASLTALVGALTLYEYGFGADLHVDQLFVTDPTAAGNGRMALAIAVIFVLDGLSILLADRRPLYRLFHALAIAASFISLLLFAHVWYGAGSTLLVLGTVALRTTLAACVLNVGILALDEEHGLIAALQRPGWNGAMARRLLPAAVLAPLLLGWVRLYFQRQGYYGTEFGLALLTTTIIMLLVVLIWFNTNSLLRMETREAEAREQLAQQTADLRQRAALIDHSHDGIITMDSTRHIRSWNQGAQALYQWTADEAMGQVTHQFLQTIGPVTTAEQDRILAQTGRWDGELVHKRRDGKSVTVDSRQILLRNESGEVAGILEINRDITASRALEEQLRQSQKLESIGQLAAGIAHDFNNLLTVISGYGNMVLMEPSLDPALHGSVEEIITAADRAAGITQKLLAFSRRQIAVPQNVGLNEVTAGMENMLRRLIGEQIDFRLFLDPEGPVVFIDPGQLEQVIMNLAVNARDAIAGTGKIAVETGHLQVDGEYSAGHFGVKAGAYAMLAVSDTGMGMSADVRAHIFEPFFTTKEKGKGTGLGLSTVYGIVEQNKGAITVYSDVGTGTTFKILLPLADGPAGKAQATTALPALEGTETVLLVEDEGPLRQYVMRVLERHGYRVIAAVNGKAALEVAGQGQAFDLLLTDVVMPEMGGIELADRMTAILPKVAVLHISGYTDRLWERGEAGNFLQKPFTAAALLTKIRAILDARIQNGA